MALAATALPFGLRDVKITPINDDGSLGTAVDLPNSQTFSFEEAEEFTELRGDDQLVAVRGQGPQVEWSLEAGGISLDAYKVIAGGNVAESGVSPDAIKTLSKKGTDSRPYFKVEGQAISDSGGDIHVVIYRCRATGNIGGEFSDGEFYITSCDGQALPDPNNADALYDIVQNETVTAIA